MPLPISFLDSFENWRLFHKNSTSNKADESGEVSSGAATPRHDGGPAPEGMNGESEKGEVDNAPIRLITPRILSMAGVVSIGGLIFGYDTGQISGFLAMSDFKKRFGSGTPPSFSNVRAGTIVGLLSIGTMIGALSSAPIADVFGRRVCIVVWNLVFIVGVIIQISSSHDWVQLAMGRWVAGLGVGGLSV